MIRPLTIATFLLACGSGLYLYQSKHEVQLLDRTIERIVHETSTLREQSRLLAAEWTMLNDPGRLRQFSNTYLTLKTIAPSQFSSLADLDVRLPAAQAEVLSNGTDKPELAPLPDETVVPIVADSTAALAADDILPVPPVPAPTSVASIAHPPPVRTVERAPASRPVAADTQSRPATVADAHAPEPRVSEPHVSDPHASDPHASDTRPAAPHIAPRVADAHPIASPPRRVALAAPRTLLGSPPVNIVPTPIPSRPAPAALALATTPAPYGGSLLGIAHSSMPPAPRPTPVIATYNSN